MTVSIHDFKRAFSVTSDVPAPVDEAVPVFGLGKKKKTLVPYRAPSDPVRTGTLLERLRNATVDAEKAGLTLNGTLATRRQEVLRALDTDDYDTASDLLDTLERDLAAAVQAKGLWDAAAAGYAELRRKVYELQQWRAPEAPGMAPLVLEVADLLDDEKWDAARTKALALDTSSDPSVSALHAMYPGRMVWSDRAPLRRALETNVGELEAWGVNGAGAFRERWTAIQGEATDDVGKYGDAVAAFDQLHLAVEGVHKPLRDEQANYRRDRPIADSEGAKATGHAEVAYIQAEADAIQKLLADAADLAVNGDFARANTKLAKVLLDVPPAVRTADDAAERRLVEMGHVQEWATDRISALESKLTTNELRRDYASVVEELKAKRVRAIAMITIPRHDFDGCKALAGEVWHGVSGAMRSVASYEDNHKDYELERATAAEAIQTLKSHDMAEKIDAEIQDLEARLLKADFIGQSTKGAWKNATLAVAPIPSLCARASKVADGIAASANFRPRIMEALLRGGMSQEDAEVRADVSQKLMVLDHCSYSDAMKMAEDAAQFMAQGMSESDALTSAQVHHQLVEDDVDEEIALAVAKNMRSGGTATSQDAKAVAAKLAELPKVIIDKFNECGIQTFACRGSVTDLEPTLSGVQPRGWDSGDTWDIVPGVYLPSSQRVVAGTIVKGDYRDVPETGEGHGAAHLVGHEAGHGFDMADDGPPKHKHASFQAARNSDIARANTAEPRGLVGGIDNYFLTKDENGANTAGAESETFAESVALFAAGQTDRWPALLEFWNSGNPWLG